MSNLNSQTDMKDEDQNLSASDYSSGGFGGMDNYSPIHDEEMREIETEMLKAERELRVKLAAQGKKLVE